MERRMKTCPHQWSKFLDFAEVNPEIVTKSFERFGGRQKYDNKWKEITTILNNMDYQYKPVEKWQKAVSDWKSKVKGKVARIKKESQLNGNRLPSVILNENERRLVAIMGSVTPPNDVNNTQESEDFIEVKIEPLRVADVETKPEDHNNENSVMMTSPPPLIYSKDSSGSTELESSSIAQENTSPTPINIGSMQETSVKVFELLNQTLHLVAVNTEKLSKTVEKLAESQERLAESQEKLFGILSKCKNIQ